MESNPGFYVCPEEHPIPDIGNNYGKVFSEEVGGVDNKPISGSGLYHHPCGRVYGLNKLELISEPP